MGFDRKMRAATSASASTHFTSYSRKRALSGTATAPNRQAANIPATITGVFEARIPTRWPGATAAAMRSASPVPLHPDRGRSRRPVPR